MEISNREGGISGIIKRSNIVCGRKRKELMNAGRKFIGRWEEAPRFIQDNEYIRSGYRINFHNIRSIFCSLFMLHNETVNVWSHLIGVFIFFVLIFIVTFYLGPALIFPTYQAIKAVLSQQFAYKLPQLTFPKNLPEFMEVSQIYIMDRVRALGEHIINLMPINSPKFEYLICRGYYSNSSVSWSIQQAVAIFESYSNSFGESILAFLKEDTNIGRVSDQEVLMNHVFKWPIYIQIGCAMFCLLCSATYHLFNAHFSSYYFFARLDYAGIAILICGSPYPPIIYGFACTPKYTYFYLPLITVTCLIAFITMLIPKLATPIYRNHRAILFVGSALFVWIPLFHLMFSTDLDVRIDSVPWILGALTYLLGAILFATRMPEKLKPGHFDIIGSSHQLFHLMVLAAALLHLYGSIRSYQLRKCNICLSLLQNIVNTNVS